MDFGDAFKSMKAGFRVRRIGWTDYEWMCFGEARTIPHTSFGNKHILEFADKNGGAKADILKFTILKTKTNIIMGWAMTQIDMLAEDWEVVL